MSPFPLELEGVFATPLEAYRMADQLGLELGCRTLVLSTASVDGRSVWEVYSYAGTVAPHGQRVVSTLVARSRVAPASPPSRPTPTAADGRRAGV